MGPVAMLRPSPLSAHTRSMSPGVRSSPPMGTSSTPQACSSAAASSPSIALKAHAGVEKPSAPRGSEFTCDMASAGFGRREPVEPEPRALGRQLPRLDVVSPAGALLVAAAGDAVEQPRLARPSPTSVAIAPSSENSAPLSVIDY